MCFYKGYKKKKNEGNCLIREGLRKFTFEKLNTLSISCSDNKRNRSVGYPIYVLST